MSVFGKAPQYRKGREALVYPQISWLQFYLQFISVHFHSLVPPVACIL